MSRSRFLSITSGLVVAATTACCGGNDSCGPGSAAADGLALTGSGVNVTYAGLTARPNNDCLDPSAPAGVVSLTISGEQVDTGFPITLCVGRPDLLGSGVRQLGTDVKVMDVSADLGGGCTLAVASTPAPTGSVQSSGVCGNGSDAAGFAMTIENGVVAVNRTCGTNVDRLMLALAGTFAVSGPP
jgi:hypothetical protein